MLFQGWAITANNIISLVMCLKIRDAHKGKFVVMGSKFCEAAHFQIIFLAVMEVYLGRYVSKN